MARVRIGAKVPDFKLPATGDQEIRLSDLRGKTVVLYFYPKDNTPGCTTEAAEFRDLYPRFKRRKAVVLGVSRDSVRAHENFKAKLGLPFDLLSDSEEKVCTLFDVIKDKQMYGRKVRGIERSTFLIDADGVLRQAFRKVKAKGHAEEVLAALKSL